MGGADSASCGRCPEIQCDTQAQECDIVLLSVLLRRDTMTFNRLSNTARHKSLTRGQISRHARKVISEAFFTQLVISKDGSLVSLCSMYCISFELSILPISPIQYEAVQLAKELTTIPQLKEGCRHLFVSFYVSIFTRLLSQNF